jgi:hypothetical protein
MFITARRHNAEVERLIAEIQATDDENFTLEAKVRKLEKALADIVANRTPAANATVSRMAKIAEEALGITPQAKFVTDEPAPAGTLKQIAKLLRNNPAPKKSSVVSEDTTYVAAFDWDSLNDATDYSTLSESSYGGYAGGESGGGGASGSWDSGSSYDSGSSGGFDGGSSGGCD